MKHKAKADWPAQNVEIWPLDKIIPYDKNPRWHPDKQIELLAKLMQRFGVDQPIVVDENGVILKGHGRKLAALTAGFAEFPVVIHRDLSPADKDGLRIADNQVGLLAGWDDELLRMQVNELRNGGFDLPMLGFDDGQLNAFGLEIIKGETDIAEEWQGMPELKQEDQSAFQSVIVHFKTQEAVNKFAKLLKQQITPKTKFIWFPHVERNKLADKRYES